jgi:hypothetical protein
MQYQSCCPQCEMPAIRPHADYWYSVLNVNYRLWPQYAEGSVTGIRYVPCFMGLSQSALRLTTGWAVWGSNPGGGRDFSYPSRPALGPSQHPIYNGYCGSFLGVKRPGRGVALTIHPIQMVSFLKVSPPKYTSTLPHTSYMPNPSHSSRFDYPRHIWWAVQIDWGSKPVQNLSSIQIHIVPCSYSSGVWCALCVAGSRLRLLFVIYFAISPVVL